MPGPIAKIHLDTTHGKYDVSVQRGLLADAGTYLRELNASSKAIVITDSNIPVRYQNQLRESLEEEGFSIRFIVVPAGEEQKSIEHVIKLYDQILPMKLDRDTPLVALGGGVIGDMTGFVAATTLRGIPFVQIPTSLLAMVDASVGGKTGVNHQAGKNLIGSFHQPIAVFIDPDVLRTLPPRELRGGLAECIKHEIIRDAEGFARLEANINRALSVDLDYLTDLIAHNVGIKAKVVMNDPLEHGERAHLNFGHTFGHAIETISKYSYSHGECVALGMVAAAQLSTDLGLLPEADRTRIVKLIESVGLPTHGLTLDPNVIVEAMAYDKKAKAGRIRFVLCDRIGHVMVRDDISAEQIRQAVLSLID